MKSWGVIAITVVGFVIGVVLAGVGGLSARTTLSFNSSQAQDLVLSSNKEIPKLKKIEQYWAETDLGIKELNDLISNENCQSSEKYFVSCINSVIVPLEEQKKSLSPLTGEIEDSANPSSDSELTEKQRLIPYVQMYARQQNKLIDFEKIWKKILQNSDSKNQSSFVATGVNAFLSVYKDPHTYILPENYYDQVGSLIERSIYFVGVMFEKSKGKTIVRKVFKNSDAEVAGLKAFDEVELIDNKPAIEMSLVEISQHMRNQDLKTFDFKVRRQNNLISVQVKRRYKNLSHVQFEVKQGVQKKIALITLTKFNRGICQDIASKIKSLSKENISGLVLDLRDNPGGQLDEAACLTGLFIGMNRKTYSVEFFDPLRSNEVVLSTGSLLYTGPMVVVVNNSSASASELVAGAMKDYKRALVVGERTFGKGTFQEAEEWGRNKKISLFKTQGFYLLPSDKSPQLVGVQPDFEIDENHVKLREDSVYFNPIEYVHKKYIPNMGPAFNMVKLHEDLENCLQFTDGIVVEDPTLQKSLQILSCHRITSMLAQEYNPNEFSQ